MKILLPYEIIDYEHIDLKQVVDLILKYQKEIDNLKNKEFLGYTQTPHYEYLQHSNSINIKTLEELVNGKIRVKRGLIIIGGKISMILFGSLDSDD